MSQCILCNAKIDWAFTTSGRRTALNRGTAGEGNVWLNRYREVEPLSTENPAPEGATIRTTHLSTCTNR